MFISILLVSFFIVHFYYIAANKCRFLHVFFSGTAVHLIRHITALSNTQSCPYSFLSRILYVNLLGIQINFFTCRFFRTYFHCAKTVDLLLSSGVVCNSLNYRCICLLCDRLCALRLSFKFQSRLANKNIQQSAVTGDFSRHTFQKKPRQCFNQLATSLGFLCVAKRNKRSARVEIWFGQVMRLTTS